MAEIHSEQLEEIRQMTHVGEYCEKLHIQPLHPLITVIDMEKVPPHKKEGFRRVCSYYAVHLKGVNYSGVHYGSNVHSYEDGGLVFVAPGQVFGVKTDGEVYQPKGWALLFHPDLIHGTFLEPLFNRYTFFSYKLDEALFPTPEERERFEFCLKRMEEVLIHWAELREGTRCDEEENELYKEIILDQLKLTLDCCLIFYHRQFASAPSSNADILMRFEQVMDDYYNQEIGKTEGVLTVSYCADKLCLSTNYFSDLIRKETGISALKHIHRKGLEKAKELLGSRYTITQVSEILGFQFPQHFSKWFKQKMGVAPKEYQKSIMNQ